LRMGVMGSTYKLLPDEEISIGGYLTAATL